MKIDFRVKLFVLALSIMSISGSGKEQPIEKQVAEKIEEYKDTFIGLYTTYAEGSGETAIKIETREIDSDSSEGGELFVYTDANGRELRYKLDAYGETGNAVTNYYLCDGFVWVNKETNYYSSWILKEGFSDTLYSRVENWIVMDDKTYILHNNGELEETEPEETGFTDFLQLKEMSALPGGSETAGMGSANTKEPASVLSGNKEPAEQTEYTELFLQELLFVQQGFRQHDIEERYMIYFAEPEQSVDGLYCQDMLLEGEDQCYKEIISYTYDQNTNWYTFEGEFEPALVKETLFLLSDEEAEEFKNAAVYQTELSAKSDIDAAIRFDIPSGPVVYDQIRDEGNWGDSSLYTCVYVYQDERMGVDVEIEYPQYSIYADEIPEVEEVNQRIREAFFYGYGGAEEWSPAECMNANINRNCEITRADDSILSLCIYESNYFRGAIHPNTWKFGMTIDLKTGKLLTLRDIIGTDRTAKELTDTGAFHCLQIWRDGEMTPEMLQERDKEQVEEAVEWVNEAGTDDFYLTPDKLGLTSHIARYYVCMEAPLSEIGLREWEAEETN